jgi:hypothetical protein
MFRDPGLLVMGFGAGIGLFSAGWMIETGYRIDAEGTTTTMAEDVLGWGSLLVAVVFVALAAVSLAAGRSRASEA